MSFSQEELCKALQQRRLLCEDVSKAHKKVLNIANTNKNFKSSWNVILGDNLLFDLAGLQALSKIIQDYQGSAKQLSFKLKLSAEAVRDYYSHSPYLNKGYIDLPITAIKPVERGKIDSQKLSTEKETLAITLNELSTDVAYPLSLTMPDVNNTPLALLMPYSCDHDCLFANQIAVFSNLNQKLKSAPKSWLGGFFNRRKISLNRRISLAWKQVHPTADIHPSAVIEGAVIGANCRIGAHCVVRYSVLGKNVVLHDGAKAEYSVVDDKSWLMHDLVLYRSLAETDVFLIHGPYQFSYFQKQSAAFASIMMDYRPDNKPIRINVQNDTRSYQGRFLGALLEEKARVFGGTLTAPGITIPYEKEIYCSKGAITTPYSMNQLK